MAFILTEEQQMMVDLARDFARKEIAPVSEKMDREAKFIPGLIEQMAELGFMGINVPEEYGGAGLDEVTKALVIEEFAKVDASVAEMLSVHTLSSDIILRNGTEEQKKKYLAKACQGCVGAFALTNQMPVQMQQLRKQKPLQMVTIMLSMVQNVLSAIWDRMKVITLS